MIIVCQCICSWQMAQSKIPGELLSLADMQACEMRWGLTVMLRLRLLIVLQVRVHMQLSRVECSLKMRLLPLSVLGVFQYICRSHHHITLGYNLVYYTYRLQALQWTADLSQTCWSQNKMDACFNVPWCCTVPLCAICTLYQCTYRSHILD